MCPYSPPGIKLFYCGAAKFARAAGLRHATRKTLYSSKVATAVNLPETVAAQQAPHGIGLIPAMFDPQHALRFQPGPRAADNDAQRPQAIAPFSQCAGRFETQVALLEVRIARGYVRRIRENQIE